MDIILNLERIQNREYQFSKNDLSSIIEKYHSLKLEDFLNTIWETVSKKYWEQYDLCDFPREEIKTKILSEMVLQFFTTISIYTSDKIKGVDKFLDSTIIYESKSDSTAPSKLTFENKNTFEPKKHTEVIEASWAKTSIVLAESDIPKVNELTPANIGQLVIQNTPLSDFISTHFYIERDKQKNSYTFNKEGRYFLSILFRAISSTNSPYTTKTLSGISLDSLNSFIERFYRGYYSFTLKDNPSERLLLVCNLENIFQYSFLKSIFSNLGILFSEQNRKVMPAFRDSFLLIERLQSCQFHFAKQLIWAHCCADNVLSYNTTVGNYINVFDELYDLLFYLLFQYATYGSESWDTYIPNNFISYLSNPKNIDFSWCTFYQNSRSFDSIPSFLHEYFTFYILYHFYFPDRIKNYIFLSDLLNLWDDNFYIRYLFENKK